MIITIKIPSRNKPRRGEINTTLSGLDWNGLFTGYNHCTPSGLGYGSVDFYNHCTLSGLGYGSVDIYNHYTPLGFKLI